MGNRKIFIHHLSDVQTQYIGNNTKIWQFVVILDGAVIGDNCNINCNCFIENEVKIGNNVTVKSGVQLWNGIIVEDNVFIGPNTTFTNDKYPRSKQYPEAFPQTIIQENASIGANATILPICICDNVVIGAGSVVTKDIKTSGIYAGNPSRLIRNI